jgi:hypothetical protein
MLDDLHVSIHDLQTQFLLNLLNHCAADAQLLGQDPPLVNTGTPGMEQLIDSDRQLFQMAVRGVIGYCIVLGIAEGERRQKIPQT